MEYERLVKTAEGLRRCIALENPRGLETQNCEVCPYRDDSTCDSHVPLFTDALEAVNELIPRALTLEEADDLDICYLQMKGTDAVAACQVWAVLKAGGKATVKTFAAADSELPEYEYGVTWVCWSRRPTQEQRRAIRWA